MIWTQAFAEHLGGEILFGTPDRIERFGKELQVKRDYDRFTTFETESNDMVIVRGIHVFSFCSHHLLPYFGSCSIGYIPDGRILGISKFQRLVDKFASKPTVQEELTKEIVDFADSILKTQGVACVMDAKHTCAMGRGIENHDQEVSTQVMTGLFRENEVKMEFLARL